MGSLKRQSWTSNRLVCLVEGGTGEFRWRWFSGCGRTDALRVLLEVAPTMVELKALFDEMDNL